MFKRLTSEHVGLTDSGRSRAPANLKIRDKGLNSDIKASRSNRDKTAWASDSPGMGFRLDAYDALSGDDLMILVGNCGQEQEAEGWPSHLNAEALGAKTII